MILLLFIVSSLSEIIFSCTSDNILLALRLSFLRIGGGGGVEVFFRFMEVFFKYHEKASSSQFFDIICVTVILRIRPSTALSVS